MVDNAPKVAVNPLFISSVRSLRAARAKMLSAKFASQGTNDENLILKYRKAEEDFHRAEAVFCHQKGLIDGGNLTQAQGKAQVDAIMNSVHSWYA